VDILGARQAAIQQRMSQKSSTVSLLTFCAPKPHYSNCFFPTVTTFHIVVHGFYICAHCEEYKDIIVAGMGVVLWCCSAGTAWRSLGQKRGGSEHCLMCAVTLTHAWPVCLPFGNWTNTGAQLVVLLHTESQSLLWRTTINLENATPIECPSSYGGMTTTN
jgi:hypothetical protein